MKSIKSFLSQLNKTKSRLRPLNIAQHQGQPIWRHYDYQALVKEGYESNVIVYRAVNLIARGIASVPWRLYEKNEASDEIELSHHPLLELLHHPSPLQAGSSFFETVVGYLLLAGNAYIEAVLDDQGLPVELYPLRPDRVSLIPSETSEMAGIEYQVGGVRKKILFPELGRKPILQLKFFHPLHDYYGLSPLQAAARAIDQHNEVAGHNLSLMQNGGRPTGALIVKDQNLSREQREWLREDLKQLYQGGTNAGKIMILEGEFEWKEMGLSPKDMDFLEGKNISAREIAQAFGVPSMLVGVAGDATYANYKEARLHLWEDTILPLLEHIVDELNLWLVPYFSENLRLSYDIDGIPALSEKREAHWAKIASADFLTVNEKRQAVGYSPIAGGDKLGECHEDE